MEENDDLESQTSSMKAKSVYHGAVDFDDEWAMLMKFDQVFLSIGYCLNIGTMILN
jgi:hypothetical protein